MDVLDHRDDLRRGRRRFRPSVLVLVQPRLPGAAPDRLVDAGDRAGKDHPLRSGARNPRLGRSAPAHRSARPALLCLLPSGAGRRAADLRRGRARRATSRPRSRRSSRDRARGRGDRQGPHRGVLFDLQLPARPCRRFVRQFPDQAGGRGDLPRDAEALDLRDAVAGAEFCRLAQARARGRELRGVERGRQGGARAARSTRLVDRSRKSRRSCRIR